MMTARGLTPPLDRHDAASHLRRGKMRRQTVFTVAFIAGLFLLGGLCGLGARAWIGGLRVQHARLQRCILASRHSHASEDARSTLAHLEVEVPACMDAAGYERALDDQSCSPASWQGDVFCYVPKSYLGRLIYRTQVGQPSRMLQSHEARQGTAER
jgi:hypothetical protein